MKQFKIKILKNEKVGEVFYKMRLESPYLARRTKPGQFVEIKCSDTTAGPLLRRPLGCHRVLKNGIELLYETVGAGTKILSGKQPGDKLDLIGPLGNGFSITALTKSAILVGGGIGVAPLVALAEELLQRERKVCVIIGARRRSHILCERHLKKLGCVVKAATEDGSKGYRGLATELLRELLATSRGLRSTIYASGPNGMLKEVATIAKEKNLSCQISLEEHMACGVGVCLGCPVKVRRPAPAQYAYQMVCKDGPVFNAEDIIW